MVQVLGCIANGGTLEDATMKLLARAKETWKEYDENYCDTRRILPESITDIIDTMCFMSFLGFHAYFIAVFWEGKVLQIDGFRYPVCLRVVFFGCFSSASSKHFDHGQMWFRLVQFGKNTQLP